MTMKKFCTLALIALLAVGCAGHRKTAVQTQTEENNLTAVGVKLHTVVIDSTDEMFVIQFQDSGAAVKIDPQGAINAKGVKSISGHKKKRQKARNVANLESLDQKDKLIKNDSVNKGLDINKPPDAVTSKLSESASRAGWFALIGIIIVILVYTFFIRLKNSFQS